MKILRIALIAFVAFILGSLTQAANAQVKREDGYQVDLWFLGTAKSGSLDLQTFYYADDVMRCTIFAAPSNGIAPVCFDRQPKPPVSQP